MILSGKEVAENVRGNLKTACDMFKDRFACSPCLAVVLAGDNAASMSYVKSKRKACDEVGIDHKDYFLESGVSEEELVSLIRNLNNDSSVDGILVQLPLPPQIRKEVVIDTIRADKDVDGFSPENMGKLFLGQKCLTACTPKGIMRIIDYYNIKTCGRSVCVVGRSNIVGKPVAALLMQRDRNATVTVCNSFTPDIAVFIKQADIVICAVGKPGTIDSSMVKEGAVVIDVGINRVSDSLSKKGYRITGDVIYESVSQIAGAITPVPGGVGPMTVAMLLENTFQSACIHHYCTPDDFGYKV